MKMEDEEEEEGEMGHQQSIVVEQAGEGSFISFHHDASALESVGSTPGFDQTAKGVPRGQSYGEQRSKFMKMIMMRKIKYHLFYLFFFIFYIYAKHEAK